MQMNPTKIRKMKNKTVIYLAKGEKECSALLKRRAVQDYFETCSLGVLENGKPVIQSPEGYGISVSHSGGVIAVVIAPCQVGIDIQLRLDRDNTKLKSFFHESEKNCDFYDLWVKKEAWGKLTGKGIFLQKGKKLEAKGYFYDISKEISQFAGKAFSASVICETETEREFCTVDLKI